MRNSCCPIIHAVLKRSRGSHRRPLKLAGAQFTKRHENDYLLPNFLRSDRILKYNDQLKKNVVSLRILYDILDDFGHINDIREPADSLCRSHVRLL